MGKELFKLIEKKTAFKLKLLCKMYYDKTGDKSNLGVFNPLFT